METLKKLYRRYNESYHAVYLLLGTSRVFLIADFGFMFDAIIDPIFSKRKLAKIPFYIWGVLFIVAITSIYSPEAFQGMTTALRILILALILPTYKYRYKFKQMTGTLLIILALIAIGQSAFMLRSNGIQSSSSMLGQVAFVYAPIFWVQISLAVVLILSLSIARSPLVALILFAVITRKQYFLALAGFAAVIFVIYAAISTPGRVTFSGIKFAVTERIETVTGFDDKALESRYADKICGEFREEKITMFGYGWNGYCKSTGQPRPHNIYALTIYELGIIAIPFWLFILYGAYKFGFWKLAPLFALGLVTEELLGRPEGIYLIAIWIISVQLSGDPDPDINRTFSKFG